MPTTNRHVGQDVSQQAVQHQRPPHPSSYQHDYSQQQYSLPPVYPQHPPHVPFQQGQYSQSQYSQQPNVDQYSPHQSYGQQENTPTVWPSSAPVTLPQLPNHRIDVASNEDRARNCIEEFDEYFGKNPFALWALQKLCRVAWINPPDSIQGCRTALKGVHMNIFDVVEEGGRTGRVSNTFTSRREMVNYSRERGKMWPKRVNKFKANRLMAQLMQGFN